VPLVILFMNPWV